MEGTTMMTKRIMGNAAASVGAWQVGRMNGGERMKESNPPNPITHSLIHIPTHPR